MSKKTIIMLAILTIPMGGFAFCCERESDAGLDPEPPAVKPAVSDFDAMLAVAISPTLNLDLQGEHDLTAAPSRSAGYGEPVSGSPLEETSRSMLAVCGAKVLTTLTHELGHADEAIDQGLGTRIDMTAGLTGGTRYSSSSAGALGSFEYTGKARDEARICLAGIGSNLGLYNSLHTEIANDPAADTRFANAVAMLAGLELARYVLWDSLTEDESSDLNRYQELTDTDDEFIYAAAALNAIDFWLSGGTYHAKRTIGLEARRPESTGLFGTGIRACPWIEDSKICVGLIMDVSF